VSELGNQIVEAMKAARAPSQIQKCGSNSLPPQTGHYAAQQTLPPMTGGAGRFGIGGLGITLGGLGLSPVGEGAQLRQAPNAAAAQSGAMFPHGETADPLEAQLDFLRKALADAIFQRDEEIARAMRASDECVALRAELATLRERVAERDASVANAIKRGRR